MAFGGPIGHDGTVTSSRPLDGIRVLDLSRVLSGPHCTRMLADLGADVIKIEPPAGDLTRFAIATPQRAVELLRPAERRQAQHQPRPVVGRRARQILLELAEHADVLVQNYRPGVMDRLGLGVDAVLARNPRLVYASISGYGQTGPWVRRRAYAPVVEAEAGIIASQGASHGGPLQQGPAQPRRRVHGGRNDVGDPRRAVPTRADRVSGSRSTCRWPRRCCTSTSTSTTRCGTATTTRTGSAASVPATTSCSRWPTASRSS